MYVFSPTNLVDVEEYFDFTDIFESLCIDEMEVEDVRNYLGKTSLMSIEKDNGDFYGFFSVEQIGPLEIEVHAFIVPEHRTKSKDVLETFARDIFNKTPFRVIKTTVTSDNQYVVRFLKWIGFIDVAVQHGVVKKGGGLYNLTTLKLYKGD